MVVISAYSIFKRPDLIAKGEPFLEVSLTIFQGRVNYTPNLAQEINLSRIPAATHCRKGSFDGGVGRFDSLWSVKSVQFPTGSGYITFRAALPERCFRYLDCFNGGWPRRHSIKLLPPSPVGHLQAVSIPSSLDRELKDNQGGCLYEWPVVKLCVVERCGCRCSGNNRLAAGLNWPSQCELSGDTGPLFRCDDVLKETERRKQVWGSIPRTTHFWQKPGIGPMAVRKSSPDKGSRGRGTYPDEARRKHQNPACRGEGPFLC